MNPSPPLAARPSVRVLLTTFDGERWLSEQLASIAAQQDVDVSVVASDDSSTDGTPAILASAARPGSFVVLPPSPARFGNAHRNFMRVIHDAALDDVEYFALSDQDDVWLPGKLARAVQVLQATCADAYGANVTAFWSDGRRRELVKSQRQRRFDHLFESAGPGCTFVFRRAAFVQLQAFVRERFDALQAIKVHDWLIYAFARERGWRWVIDDAATMLYRQHERNEAGANAGWRPGLRRVLNVYDGHFRVDALAVGDIVGARNEVLERLRRLSLADRLWLVLHARECRRAFHDAFALGFLFLVMPRRQAT
jgi:rhamnosyltransferase